MNQPLPALWDEHRSIAAVLNALLYLVGNTRARGKALDTKAIRAILYYLDVFPERVHHVKEERFLFATLRRKTSEADPVLDALRQEHLRGEHSIRELEQLLLRCEQGGEAEFAPFAAAVERHVKGYREHMRTEEDVIMTVARAVLTESDWLALSAEWASHRDPLSGIDDQGINDQMIARIVELTPSPADLRSVDPSVANRPLQPRQRAPFSAIVDRPPLRLPGGARVVVWTIVNVEVWDIGKPMARQVLPAPAGVQMLPDVPNWSWHEYGMRVGFWRLHRLYEQLQIRPTLAVNARVCLDYPRVAAACRDAGWEFMGHSFEQGAIHREADQKAMIARSLDTLEKFTGRRPRGWLGPGLTQTLETPELLAEAGVQYIGDWLYDDEPTEIHTAHGPLVTLPYTAELNDIPMMIVQHHEADYWTRKCLDAFERYHQEGAERAKIMAIAIHPYITGQPFRIRYLEQIYEQLRQHPDVLFWNGEQILDWYRDARRAQPAPQTSAAT